MKMMAVLLVVVTAVLAGGLMTGHNMLPYRYNSKYSGQATEAGIKPPLQSSAYPVFCMARKSKPVPAPKSVNNRSQVKAEDFVLLFTGNWQGHLEPCGCTDVQLGGIDRRSDTLKKIAPNFQSRLMVDSGPMIEGNDRQSRLKLDVLIRSMAHLGYDGISLTPRELMFLQNSDTPINKRSPIIVTNTTAKARKKFHTIPWLHKTLRLRNATIDCVVITIIDPGQVKDPYTKKQMQLTEPVSALKNVLQKRGIDINKKPGKDKLIIVLLPNAGTELLRRIHNIPAVDIIVTRGAADEPEKLKYLDNSNGGTFVITTGKMGKYITRIRIPLVGKPSHSEYLFDRVGIDSHFPHDKTIDAIVQEYQDTMQMEELVADENAIPREVLEDGNRFVGSKACSLCHSNIYDKWQKTKHAHAMDTLIRVKRQFDPECVVCHSVGMKYETGYRSLEKKPALANVGCEMCHGPGGIHIESSNHDNIYKKGTFKSCFDCHNHETSPEFEKHRKEYIKNIKHW